VSGALFGAYSGNEKGVRKRRRKKIFQPRMNLGRSSRNQNISRKDAKTQRRKEYFSHE